MDSTERQHMIVQKAIEYFAEHGFEGSTRNLASRIGVTQSLLYRYFPTKKALLDQVYEEVYLARWNPHWEEQLRDRQLPFEARLKRYYLEYAQSVLRGDWVRILIFAGLKQEGINDRLFKLLRDRIFATVVSEFHHAYAVPLAAGADRREMEMELVWALHAAIFYIGMRKWVYKSGVPKKIDAVIEVLVEGLVASLMHLTGAAQAPRTSGRTRHISPPKAARKRA